MTRRLPLLLAVLLVFALAAACGSGEETPAPAETSLATAEASGGEAREIVVTYSVLGSLVRELVGGEAQVTVLMPNGVDPHDWQPSAKDVETINAADLVVANGLDLEEGLEETLEQAEAAGVPVFLAADHVDVRTIGEGEVPGEHAGEEHAEEQHAEEGEHAEGEEHGDEHGAGAADPHVWTDPLAMKAVVTALSGVLQGELGLDVSARAADLGRRLDELHAELEETLAAIPPERRKLVTGHESMGYFADRYGFELVGALVPSISSQAEASAGELAELAELIEEQDVPAIFTEIGTPEQVAQAIGDETGVTVVALPSHNLPEDGSYFSFMREIANEVATALGR